MSAVWRPYGRTSERRICWECGAEFVAERKDITFCTDRCGLLHRYHRARGQERRYLARRLGGVVRIMADLERMTAHINAPRRAA